MGKTLIKVDCVDQRLFISNAPVVASGGRNEDAIEFNFCPLWDGFEKVAVLYRNENEVFHSVISENRCIIPHEVLADAGWMCFGVFGVKEDITRTSEIMRYRVVEGAITEATKPSDPTPDLWEQLLNGRSLTEPAEDDIPKVFLTGEALPTTKDNVNLDLEYISKTHSFKAPVKIKCQGNSSMSYPKKNFTVALYDDDERTVKHKENFKGWGERGKFCLKANWVDLTHARNIVSARLWGDVVKSRSNYAQIPELLRTSPNQGAVDGFPIKVYFNGIYQGRYTWNIPKDAWMANMDDSLDNHCILCGENYVSGCFRASANIDGSDWSDEVHDTVPAAIKTRWNQVISFVMDSTDEEFVANLGNYFDVDSLIDYYVFGLVVCNNDGFGKNQIYMTYDGQKWFASAYDLDNTFGTYLGSIKPHNFPRNEYEDFKHNEGNLLYVRLESLFADVIKARYKELRNGALSLTNIVNRFERFTDICPPYLVEEDYAETTVDGAFSAIPLQGKSNIQQIRNYIVARMEYVDSIVLLRDYGLLYSLPEVTSFNGTTDYIDTGISLIDTHKDYAVFVDFAGAATQNNTTDYWKVPVMNMHEWNDSPSGVQPGFKIMADGNYQLLMRNEESTTPSFYDIPDIPNNTTNRQRYVIQKDISAGTVTFYYVSASGAVEIGVQHVLLDGDSEYTTTAIVDTLTLGSSKNTTNNGTFMSFWTGTFYDCKVWNRPLSEAEIEALLLG